jgi:hypothetical protein
MPGAIRKIFGEIGFKDKASKDLNNLDSGMEEVKTSMIGMAQIASTVVTAAFIALANASFEAAKELELQSVRLEALSGDAYPALVDSMNATIEASEGLTAVGDMSFAINQALKMGTSVELLTGSMAELQKLSEITGDELSAQLRNMARSIATGSTRFLEQNPILAKNIDGFKQLGAGYDEATKKKRELFIVDALQKNQLKIQEQYNKIVKTTSGQLKIVATQWGNIKETIGGLIINALKPLIEIGAEVFRFLGESEQGIAIVKTAFIALSIIIGVVMVLAFKALAAAAIAALIPLSPFILIALAIVAVITLMVLIIEDLIVFFKGGESVFGDFISVFIIGWELAKKGFWKFVNFFKSTFFKIVSFAKVWGKRLVMFLFPFSLIFFFWDEIISFLKSIPDRVLSFFKALGQSIVNFLVGILPDWAISLLNRISATAAPTQPAGIEFLPLQMVQKLQLDNWWEI